MRLLISSASLSSDGWTAVTNCEDADLCEFLSNAIGVHAGKHRSADRIVVLLSSLIESLSRTIFEIIVQPLYFPTSLPRGEYCAIVYSTDELNPHSL